MRHCARIVTTDRYTYVALPSPGRMSPQALTNPLDAWIDCFEMTPKHRIKVADARREIWRAWEAWEGDKGAQEAMFVFFGWLERYQPFFLTFRCKGDPWQRVHSWLLQYERERTKR